MTTSKDWLHYGGFDGASKMWTKVDVTRAIPQGIQRITVALRRWSKASGTTDYDDVEVTFQ